MNERADDCLVTGHETLIETLTLPDPNDRHVLAAAIVADAGVIVTCNLRDFPDDALEPFGIEAQHPDEFIRHLLDVAPDTVAEAVRNQQARLINPPVGMVELLALFERQGLFETASELRRLVGE
jgi:hypothetical protein